MDTMDEIRVDLPPSDSIYFIVRIINKKLDVVQFQNVQWDIGFLSEEEIMDTMDKIIVDLPPSDSIYFIVGIINKKLDVDQFQNVD
ncbi:hypothetical protein CerSpe_071480 [Prunus speciosa]